MPGKCSDTEWISSVRRLINQNKRYICSYEKEPLGKTRSTLCDNPSLLFNAFIDSGFPFPIRGIALSVLIDNGS